MPDAPGLFDQRGREQGSNVVLRRRTQAQLMAIDPSSPASRPGHVHRRPFRYLACAFHGRKSTAPRRGRGRSWKTIPASTSTGAQYGAAQRSRAFTSTLGKDAFNPNKNFPLSGANSKGRGLLPRQSALYVNNKIVGGFRRPGDVRGLGRTWSPRRDQGFAPVPACRRISTSTGGGRLPYLK